MVSDDHMKLGKLKYYECFMFRDNLQTTTGKVSRKLIEQYDSLPHDIQVARLFLGFLQIAQTYYSFYLRVYCEDETGMATRSSIVLTLFPLTRQLLLVRATLILLFIILLFYSPVILTIAMTCLEL